MKIKGNHPVSLRWTRSLGPRYTAIVRGGLDPAPLQTHPCGWENDDSSVHTPLMSTHGPLFLQLCLPCSPCLPPKSHSRSLPRRLSAISRWALHLSADPAALGRGWGWNAELERRRPLACGGPAGGHHHGRCAPLRECLGGGRRQDPGRLGPRFVGSVPRGPFQHPLWPYFQSGWSFSFRGWGTSMEGESRGPGGGQRERERRNTGRKEA